MSYGRDRDASTRGVGAIAARDKAHPGAARARAARRAAATRAHDRHMSQVTLGPRGGLPTGFGSSLDILNQAISRKTAGVTAAPSTTTRSTHPLSLSTIGQNKNLAFLQTALERKGLAMPQPALQKLRIRPKLGPGGYDKVSGVYDIGRGLTIKPSDGANPVFVDPGPPPVVPPKATAASSVLTSSSGGGGGGMVSGGKSSGGGAPIELPPDVAVPDVPDAAAGSALSSHAKLAIVGAVAAGAFLLLRRKRR